MHGDDQQGQPSSDVGQTVQPIPQQSATYPCHRLRNIPTFHSRYAVCGMRMEFSTGRWKEPTVGTLTPSYADVVRSTDGSVASQ